MYCSGVFLDPEELIGYDRRAGCESLRFPFTDLYISFLNSHFGPVFILFTLVTHDLTMIIYLTNNLLVLSQAVKILARVLFFCTNRHP